MKKLLGIFLFACWLVSPLASAQVNTFNLPTTILPSALRSATTVLSSDQTNYYYRGMVLYANVSAWTTGTYTLTVQGKDPVGGGYYTILTSAAFGTPTGLNVLHIYPGISPSTNLVANSLLPRTWRVSLTGASSPSMTFSVGAVLVP